MMPLDAFGFARIWRDSLMLSGDPDFDALAFSHSHELESHIDDTGLTPLSAACIANRASACEALAKHGALLNAIDDQGWTALHWCSRMGRLACAQILLNHGADPLSDSPIHGTPPPLIFACALRQASLAHLLVQHGARLDDQPVGSDPVYFHAAAFPEIFPNDIPSHWITAIGSKKQSLLHKAACNAPDDATALAACRFWVAQGVELRLLDSALMRASDLALTHGFSMTHLFLVSQEEADAIATFSHRDMDGEMISPSRRL